MDYLMALNWMYGGIIFVSISVLLSVVGLYFVHRSVEPSLRKKNHDVAGYTFGIVGVVYAVLLGFTVVNVNDRYNDIQKNLVQESAVMLQLYRNAEVFPKEVKDGIRDQIFKYAKLVYEEEWDRMSMKAESEQAYDHLLQLWRKYYLVEPKGERENIWLGESVTKMNALADARVMRLHNSSESLGDMMWALLVAGALITILFMYFFYIESFTTHALLTALLTGTISFMLFLILSLDTAFTGYVHIEPKEIKKTMERFRTL
jgi:membrane protein implicated in regulation of membrane protease activity